MDAFERQKTVYAKFRSLASFARIIREPRSRVSEVLLGRRQTPRIQDKIARRLKVKTEEFFSDNAN